MMKPFRMLISIYMIHRPTIFLTRNVFEGKKNEYECDIVLTRDLECGSTLSHDETEVEASIFGWQMFVV